MNIEYNYI